MTPKKVVRFFLTSLCITTYLSNCYANDIENVTDVHCVTTEDLPIATRVEDVRAPEIHCIHAGLYLHNHHVLLNSDFSSYKTYMNRPALGGGLCMLATMFYLFLLQQTCNVYLSNKSYNCIDFPCITKNNYTNSYVDSIIHKPFNGSQQFYQVCKDEECVHSKESCAMLLNGFWVMATPFCFLSFFILYAFECIECQGIIPRGYLGIHRSLH